MNESVAPANNPYKAEFLDGKGKTLNPKPKKRTNHDLSPAVFFLVAGIKFVA